MSNNHGEAKVMEVVQECSPAQHCTALQSAIDEGYLEVPILMQQTATSPKMLLPALRGPQTGPGTRRYKPTIILSFCPFCAKPLAP